MYAMKLHRGRLIDHVHLRARDLEAAKRFYLALFSVLGIDAVADDTHLAADELWIDHGPTSSHVHLAFQADDRAMVHKAYDAAIAAGGRDNGKPGERKYHPGYYAAFMLDPDGNNIEVVHHGPTKRSAKSVEIDAGGPP